MKDRTYEILKSKYAPHLLSDTPEEVTQLDDAPVSLETLTLSVRKAYLESFGLNAKDRHKWADNIVAGMVLLQLEQATGVKLQ
ncbi:hypothetical protein [Pseudomonas monteilii]|uniref:hypothetical protein n=1 Tax=Pseudomonas monteilii TaxID=76759 RepID=UPI000863761C|nr:hypothetical protein [Pseudomonas monteilii]